MKNLLAVCFLVAFSFTILPNASAKAEESPDSKWELKKTGDNIKVYFRKKTEEIVEVKVKALYKHNCEKVVKTIKNTTYYPQWVYKCQKTEYVYENGQRYLRTVTDIPWPLQDRDNIAFQKPMRHPDENTYIIESYSVPKAIPEYDGITRQEKSDVRWEIKKLDKNTTSIDYTIQIKLTEGLPDFIVESITVSGPYETFNNLNNLLKKKR